MKARHFLPAVDGLESRTVLSGISNGTLAAVDEAFKVFSATQLFNSQQLAAAGQANTTLAADKAAVLADKGQVFFAFVNFSHFNSSVNLPLLANQLFSSSSSTVGTDLEKAKLADATVPGESQLITDEAKLTADQKAINLDPNGQFSSKKAIDTLANNLLKTLGQSKAGLIRTDITGAAAPTGVLLSSGTPAKGSLAAAIQNGVPGATDKFEIQFIKDLLASK